MNKVLRNTASLILGKVDGRDNIEREIDIWQSTKKKHG
jgi:hypothetical protein